MLKNKKVLAIIITFVILILLFIGLGLWQSNSNRSVDEGDEKNGDLDTSTTEATDIEATDDLSEAIEGVLVWSMASDETLQGMALGQSLSETISSAILISGNPTVTLVEHNTKANPVSIELSNRSEDWHALDFIFEDIGVKRGGTYRFLASGRMAESTGNRTIQWNQTDQPWSAITGSQTTISGSDTEWTLDVILDKDQIQTALNAGQRGLRIQTSNAATVTMTVDDVFVYQLGEIDEAGLSLPPQWNLEEPSLAELFEPYFGIGNIYSTDSLMDAFNTRKAFLHHFNVLTAENGHKPDHIAGPGNRFTVPTPEQFDFSGADRIVDFAIENEIQLVGHALVWHSQSPNWLFKSDASTPLTREEAKARMAYYMKTLSEHFSAKGTLGAFFSWDVVNEAIESGGGTWVDQPGNWRRQMRSASPWYQAFDNGSVEAAGEHASDYIFYAFYYARQYFPTALLYYNDYNEEIPAKRNAIAQMVEEINALWEGHEDYDGRLLIEAIGMQSHYHLEGWRTNMDQVEAALDRYIATGARVSVTELDLTYGGHGSSAYTELTELQLQVQATAYERLFEFYLERAEHLSRVSIWGMADNSSWRSSGFPLLFDGRFEAKPAFKAIVDLVKNWEKPEVAVPILKTSALESLESGQAIFARLEVEPSSNVPMWFSVTDGALPEGVTLHTRTGVLEGTPAKDGIYTFTVTVRNHAGESEQSYAIEVGQQ